MYIVHFIYGWSWAGAGCGRNNLDQEESRARNLHICSDTWYRYDLLKRYGPCLMQSAVIFIVVIKISFIDIELIFEQVQVTIRESNGILWDGRIHSWGRNDTNNQWCSKSEGHLNWKKLSWSGLLYGLNFPEPSPYSNKGLTDKNIGTFNL